MSVSISITLTDAEYEEALRKSQEAGLTVAQYVKQSPIVGDEFTERYEFLISTAQEQPEEQAFTVMSLFSDWSQIPRGIRLSLGRNFYHLVKRGAVAGVTPAGKNSSNIQLYKKI